MKMNLEESLSLVCRMAAMVLNVASTHIFHLCRFTVMVSGMVVSVILPSPNSPLKFKQCHKYMTETCGKYGFSFKTCSHPTKTHRCGRARDKVYFLFIFTNCVNNISCLLMHTDRRMGGMRVCCAIVQMGCTLEWDRPLREYQIGFGPSRKLRKTLHQTKCKLSSKMLFISFLPFSISISLSISKQRKKLATFQFSQNPISSCSMGMH